MFDVGGGELILVVLAVLLLFGPKKLPEIAQMVGKGMQQVRKAQAQFQVQINEIKSELDDVGTDHQRNLRNATPVRRDQESADKEDSIIDENSADKSGGELSGESGSVNDGIPKATAANGHPNSIDAVAGPNEAVNELPSRKPRGINPKSGIKDNQPD